MQRAQAVADLPNCWEGLLGRLTGGMTSALDRVYLSATQSLRLKNTLMPKCWRGVWFLLLNPWLIFRLNGTPILH